MPSLAPHVYSNAVPLLLLLLLLRTQSAAAAWCAGHWACNCLKASGSCVLYSGVSL